MWKWCFAVGKFCLKVIALGLLRMICCPISVVILKVQFKTMRQHFTKRLKVLQDQVWWGYEKTGSLMLTAVSIISTFTVESNLAISREVEEVYISEILLHTYPRSCTQMFIALLFLTAKTRNKLGVQHNGQIVI